MNMNGYQINWRSAKTTSLLLVALLFPASALASTSNDDLYPGLVNEGGVLVGTTVLVNDTLDGVGPAQVTVKGGGTSFGVLILDLDGTFSYTHDGSENFTDSFKYRFTEEY